MVTREQIEEIQVESREKGISFKNLLKEKGIPDYQHFRWKRKYSKQEVPEGFLPVSGGGLPAAMSACLPGTTPSSRGKAKCDASGENCMSIELLSLFIQVPQHASLPEKISRRG